MGYGRFYWLKLHRDFFKRHDIQIVEAMPNGKDYILFYLKLLVESVDHEGRLRFSDTIPYNVAMLSAVTHTNEDIVKGALDVFINQLGMITLLDDATLYMNEVEGMIGSASNGDNARRQQRFRENQKALALTDSNGNSNGCVTEIVTLSNENSNESKSKSKSKNIKEINKEKSTNKFVPPTLEEIEAYCKQRNNKVNPKAFFDYFTEGKWKDAKGNPVRNWKQKIITWEKYETQPRAKSKNQFTEMIHTDYDMDAIEKMVLGD